jgi:hypothetical protein
MNKKELEKLVINWGWFFRGFLLGLVLVGVTNILIIAIKQGWFLR